MARNKYPEETVKLILDVATHLFVEKGYDATSLQDIINETNLSKGAIYHHFSSKEEIFEAISYRIGEENATDLAKDLFLDRGKILFADPAQRALPVSREILKSRTGSNTGIRIANSRVVYIAANIADIFFHSSTPLHPDRFHFSQNRRNHSINNYSCFLL